MYRPLPLLALIAMCALFLKMYQHNRLVHLTHTHQKLSKQHGDLMEECMRLRKQYAHDVDLTALYTDAQREQNLVPLTPAQIVSLREVE